MTSEKRVGSLVDSAVYNGDKTIVKNAVVVVGDQNYLLANIAVALSAKQNISRSDVRVIVYIVTANNDDLPQEVAKRALRCGISLAPIQISELERLATLHVDKAVPVSALSRLWLHKFLDPAIERFLYVDGDVMIDGPLDPLFDMAIPAGGFLAADDSLLLFETEIRQPHAYWRPYFESLQIRWSDYFNSGVLLVDRSGWGAIAEEALQYLVAYPERCRSSDQTALNVVAGSRRGRLPLIWNYQTEHMMVLDPRELGVQPAIWHFAGGPKPWDLAEWPWDESFNRSYREAERLLEGLGVSPPPVNTVMYEEGVRHRLRQRALQKWRFLFRRYTRARTIRRALV